VLFYVYGEPWDQTVVDAYGGPRYLWHLMLAQQGYIVVSVDNRATPAPRGRAWRKVIYRRMGVVNSQDQANAARRSVVDRMSTRHGWVCGGGVAGDRRRCC
jgi:dipeptidyl-peptidase-4